MTVVLRVCVAAAAVLWWFFAADWLTDNTGYHLALVFLGTSIAAGVLHGVAWWRFHRIARLIKTAEAEGLAAPGSELVAVNQRFRFAVRVLESLWVVGLGVLICISINHPGIQTNANYQRFVLTYFVGSIVLTGYLTWRDLRVLQRVQRIDAEARAAQFGSP